MAFLIVTGASGVNPDWTAAQSATGDDDTAVQQAVRFPRNIQECHGAEFTHTGAHTDTCMNEHARTQTFVCLYLRLCYQVVLTAFQQEKEVKLKSSPADLVTETDQRVETIILSAIRSQYPQHRFY